MFCLGKKIVFPCNLFVDEVYGSNHVGQSVIQDFPRKGLIFLN